MIRCQVTNISPSIDIASQQQLQQQQQQQLSRSKSLNDISNDSQISAFASDRFINLQNNVNNLPTTADGKMDPNIATIPITTTTTTNCIPQNNNMNPHYIINNDIITNNHNINLMNQIYQQPEHLNFYGNPSAFENNLRNLNPMAAVTTTSPTNQCSRPANANVFNLCNPLAINLNGVTEQIGNLHL